MAIDTRQRLIDSTRELLWEKGYAATSPRAIMDRAGVGQGSLYHHFAGKQQLASAAFAAATADTLAQAEAVLSTPGTAPQKIRGYLMRHRNVLLGCPVGRMSQDAEVLASDSLHGLLSDTFGRIRNLVRSVIEDGQRAGEFPTLVDAADLAETVLAVIQGGYVLARAQGQAAPFGRAVRGAVALIDIAAGTESAPTEQEKS